MCLGPMAVTKPPSLMTADFTEIEERLRATDPATMGSTGELWRDRKSAQTRQKILKAAVQCLASNGYAKTSTQGVAKTAQISRGTMLHHYATKADLIRATIDYIYYDRLEAFCSEAKELTDEERAVDGQALEIYWRLIKRPAYDAYMELCMAARTDDVLARVLSSGMQASNDFFMEVIPSIFPEWQGRDFVAQQVALDLVVTALDGLRLNTAVIQDPARRAAVRKAVFDMVLALRESD